MGTVAVLFFGFTCGSSMAIDTMSWSPRTPAGGAPVSDPNFWVRQAVIAEWGADAVYLGARKNINESTQTSDVTGGDRRYGEAFFDDQGNVILFNFRGEQIEKRDNEIVSFDASQNSFYYFTPQTTHVTSTQITETTAP